MWIVIVKNGIKTIVRYEKQKERTIDNKQNIKTIQKVVYLF